FVVRVNRWMPQTRLIFRGYSGQTADRVGGHYRVAVEKANRAVATFERNLDSSIVAPRPSRIFGHRDQLDLREPLANQRWRPIRRSVIDDQYPHAGIRMLHQALQAFARIITTIIA